MANNTKTNRFVWNEIGTPDKVLNFEIKDVKSKQCEVCIANTRRTYKVSPRVKRVFTKDR